MCAESGKIALVFATLERYNNYNFAPQSGLCEPSCGAE